MDEIDDVLRRTAAEVRGEAAAGLDVEGGLRAVRAGAPSAARPTSWWRGDGARRLWAAGSAAVLVAAAVAALVVINRDDPPEQPVATPSPLDTVAPLGTTTTAPPTTAPATTSAPPTTSVPSSTAPSTPAVASSFQPACVERTPSRSTPPQFGDTAVETFGPLGAAPAISVTLPQAAANQDGFMGPASAAAERIPGGVVIAARAADSFTFPGSILSAVDLDGVVRWQRCLDRTVRWMRAAPASAEPTTIWVQLDASDGGAPMATTWELISLDDGTSVGDLAQFAAASDIELGDRTAVLAELGDVLVLGPSDDAAPITAASRLVWLDTAAGTIEELPYPPGTDGLQRYQVDLRVVDGRLFHVGQLPATYRNVPRAVVADGQWATDAEILADSWGTYVEFGNDYGPDGTELPPPPEGDGMVTLALQAYDSLGRELWRRDDLVSPMREGFQLARDGDVVVAAACSSVPAGVCEDGTLVGVDAATGETRWALDGERGVTLIADGHAMVASLDGSGNEVWTLIDTATGEPAGDDQTWTEPGAFSQECCGGGEFVWAAALDGVVVATRDATMNVWLPASLSSGADAVTVSVP